MRSRPHASILAAAVTFGLGCSLLFSSPQTALAQNSGWNHDDNSWTYLLSDGTYASGWLKTPNGKWFYFDPESHKMVTGYLDNGDGKSYWLDESKGLVYDEWVKVKDAQGNWMHTNKEGCLVTGWYRAGDGAWWYFDNNGYAQFGALTNLNHPFYIDYSKGLLYDRWVQDAKGNWLHTDDNGVLATGWFKTKSGYWFYFNQDHTMKTGILTDRGYTFWLDKKDGLLYNEWVKDSKGNWLHTDGNGCLVKGWYHAPNGKWFYFNKDNYQMVTGKLTDDHKDYWLDENAGLLYDRWAQDSQGNWLHTDDNGVLATGWFKTKSGYWFYFNQDHTMKTGILTDRGYTFWLDKKDGLLYNEWVKDSKGNWLHTDGNGCLVKGWYHAPNGKWFYFNKDNYQMVTGKLTDDHKDYWLDENAGLLYDRWVQDSQGNWLHTDDNGCLVKGWFYTSNGKLFYFNDDYRMVTGELTYKGKIYSLDPQEGLVSVKDIPIRHTQAYEDGAFAFFKAKGATRALEILNKADYASFTHKGNPHDATAVKNMLASIPEMKVCNALRARHGLKPLRVTYELVAMAMSDANWSSSHIAHAQQFNVGENLAWYREKPFTGWYDKEKALYDADPVKNKAAAGHYLNIIDQDYECTGFAIATYANNEYRQPCFGQTFLSETNDSKSMTVDEYERELTQWVKSTQA